jgi:hypothetical protein
MWERRKVTLRVCVAHHSLVKHNKDLSVLDQWMYDRQWKRRGSSNHWPAVSTYLFFCVMRICGPIDWTSTRLLPFSVFSCSWPWTHNKEEKGTYSSRPEQGKRRERWSAAVRPLNCHSMTNGRCAPLFACARHHNCNCVATRMAGLNRQKDKEMSGLDRQ